MKKIILLIIIAFHFCDFGPSPLFCEVYTLPEKIKGGFRKCEIHSYSDGLFGWSHEEGFRIIYYDSTGNNIEEVDYDENDSIRLKTTYKYNEKNKIISKTVSNKNQLFFETSFYYDKNDSIVEVKIYSYQNEKINGYKFQYDELGRNIEKIGYDNDKINFKYIYKYDNNNNNIELIKFNAMGILQFIDKQVFDENKNLIEQKRLNSDSSLVYKYGYILTYNEGKQVMESKKYDSNNDLFTTSVYEYNEDALLSIIHLDGKSKFHTVEKFDKNNKQIEQYSKDESDCISGHWVKKYDEFGNLLEDIIYKDNENKDPEYIIYTKTYKHVYIYSK